MGAWGEGPFSNDTACDWRDERLRPVIKRAVLNGEPEEAFAALTLVYCASLAWDFEKEELESTFARIEKYDRDSGWVDYKKRAAQVAALKQLLCGPRSSAKEPGIIQLIAM
jgi:hypothetical protein